MRQPFSLRTKSRSGHEVTTRGIHIIDKKADEIRGAYRLEVSDEKRTAFDLLQSFTRAAQTFDAHAQETVESAAGQILMWDSSRWSEIEKQAKRFSEKQLKSVFATVS